MNKGLITILFTVLLIGVSAQQTLALEGWEANITVTSGSSESRFSFGQRPDATDLEDGFYDVPAMLSGDLQVYSQTREGAFWRDIRGTDQGNEWQLVIMSQTQKTVYIAWDSANLPKRGRIKLVDAANGKETDMKTAGSYTIGSSGEALFTIEVTNN